MEERATTRSVLPTDAITRLYSPHSCFVDELVPEEIVQCQAGHVFCKPCVANYVSNLVGGEFGAEIIAKNVHHGRLACFSSSGGDCESCISRAALGEVQGTRTERPGDRGEVAVTVGRPPLAVFDDWLVKRSCLEVVQDASGFQRGDRVLVKGLTSEAGKLLNGKCAEVLQFLTESGRYELRFEDGKSDKAGELCQTCAGVYAGRRAVRRSGRGRPPGKRGGGS